MRNPFAKKSEPKPIGRVLGKFVSEGRNGVCKVEFGAPANTKIPGGVCSCGLCFDYTENEKTKERFCVTCGDKLTTTGIFVARGIK